MIEGEALRTGLAQIADLKPGEDVASHEPSNCPCFIWRSLTKEYLSLKNELAAAAGLREPDTEPAIRTAAEWARTKFGDYSELTKHLPWPGCLCVTEERRQNRRGRPSLKRSFYLLAAEFIAVVRAGGESMPRGFYKALSQYLSFPWYGINFTAGELRKAVCEWYARSPGISPAGRAFYP